MSEVIRIPEPGDLVGGQFLLGGEIGRGGFGIVFKARQLGIERHVAVKMLMPHALTHEGVVERFKREARLASSLTHPNSVTIYAYGIHSENEDERGLPYLAMECLSGVTLHEYLFQYGREGLDLENTTSILKQTLGSLAEAHRRGIVHRDLKPENIFIVQKPGHQRVIKVLDFGIAKAIDGDWDPETRERLTRTGLITGTAEYMAPEQATGQRDVTPALDVYALGCITYQMLTGQLPFSGNSPMEIAIKHIAEAVPPLPPELSNLFLGQVVRKALAKEPSERFKDATDFLKTLEKGSIDPNELGYDSISGDDGDPGAFKRNTLQNALGAAIAAQNPASAPTRVAVAAPAPPDPLRTPALWVAVAATCLALAAIALVLAIANEDEPPAEVIVTQFDNKKEAPVPETTPSKAQTAKTDTANVPPIAETPKKTLPEVITIRSATEGAGVWRGNDKLGETPLAINRKDQGSAPFSVEIRAPNHEPQHLSVDWSKPPEDRVVDVKLEKSVTRTKPTATRYKKPKAESKAVAKKSAPPKSETAPKKAESPPASKPKKPKKTKVNVDLWQ